MLIVTPNRNAYTVSFYGARNGRTFDTWSSKPLSHARALRFKLRIERRHRRHIRAAEITRTVECGRTGVRYTVVRCNGWAV